MSDIFYSPDGQVIAVGVENILHWFDASTFKEIGSLRLGFERIYTLAFSPDNQFVGVGSGVSKAQIVDLGHQTILATIKGRVGEVSDLIFTPNSQYMAYRIGDRFYDAIGLWDIRGNKQERVFEVINPEHYYSLSGPAISPDGILLAAGSSEKQVYIWNLASSQTQFVLEGHVAGITSVAFSPDGELLASGSRDNTVRLWNPHTGSLVRIISGMTDQVWKISFSPDGEQIEIVTNDLGVLTHYIWDMSTNKLNILDPQVTAPDPFAVEMHRRGFSQSFIPHSGQVLFSPDSRILALGSEPVLLWDLKTRTVTSSLEGNRQRFITAMQYSPDGQRLAAKDDLGNLRVWDVQTGEALIRQHNMDDVQAFAFSSNNTLLALAKQDVLEIWDITLSRLVSTIALTQGTESITNLAFSSDGSQLLSTSEAWEVASGKLLRHFELPEVSHYVFGATAMHWPYFARNNADESKSWIEIWNLENEQIVLTLTTPQPETEPIHFSPDGSLLMAVSNFRLYIWNTITGKVVLEIGQVSPTSDAAIRWDNHMLAIEYIGHVALWDIGEVTKNESP